MSVAHEREGGLCSKRSQAEVELVFDQFLAAGDVHPTARIDLRILPLPCVSFLSTPVFICIGCYRSHPVVPYTRQCTAFALHAELLSLMVRPLTDSLFNEEPYISWSPRIRKEGMCSMRRLTVLLQIDIEEVDLQTDIRERHN